MSGSVMGHSNQLAPLVDASWYWQQYPDVARAKVDPRQHFVQHGFAEGRWPCAMPALTIEIELWQTPAPELLLTQLEAMLCEPQPLQQGLAAWVLARWYASWGQWSSVLKVLDVLLADKLALLMIRHQGPYLLAFSTYLHTDQKALAARLLLNSHWPDTPDKLLAASMLHQGKQKIAQLNTLFHQQGLRMLKASDNPRLDNLRCQSAGFRFPRWRQPLVTVIVPCYNAEATIATALHSLLQQSHRQLDILVVDDASTDASCAKVLAIAERDNRIRLVQQIPNQGAYAARNRALQQASGQFITTHDADDWSHPQKIELQLAALSEAKEAMASLSCWVRARDDLQFERWRMEEGWIYPNVSSLMFRREVVQAIGYWDRVSVNADTEYCYRLRRYYGDAAIVMVRPGIPLAFGRADNHSLSQTSATHLRTQFRGVRRDYHEAAVAWQQSASLAELYLDAEPEQRPFAVPPMMCRGSTAVQQQNIQLGLARSGWFDAKWYHTTYPDLAQADIDPLTHFILHGAQEGRDPGPNISFSGFCYQQHISPSAEALKTLLNQAIPPGPVSIDGALAWHPHHPVMVCVAHQVSAGQFGAERSFLDVLHALQNLPLDLVVVLPSAHCVDYAEQVRQYCQKLLILPYSWWQADRAAQAITVEHFASIYRQYQAQVLYVNTLVLWEPLLAARQLSLRAVVHVRELPEHDPELCTLLAATPEQIKQHLLTHAEVFIANSATVSAFLAQPEQTVVIANSIDVAQFPLTPLPDEDALCVVMLSSNLPKKGLADVVELAHLCEQRQIKARFKCFGPHNSFTEALQQQGLPTNLAFCGYVDLPQQALAQADVVLNVSHFQESFGRSVLEAMASGRTVLCYDWGALSEWVSSDCGILVPFADINALADQLADLSVNKSRLSQMGMAARSYVAEHFSPDQLAHRLKDVFITQLALARHTKSGSDVLQVKS